MSYSPRPILKQSQTSAGYPLQPPSHAVHFPPSPSLARTFDAHSSTHYDRSPIEVAPNSCALPERGCPGRTYTLDDRSGPIYPSSRLAPTLATRGHVHPRALRNQPDYGGYGDIGRLGNSSSGIGSLPPPLIPDISSESEESDGFISPPPPHFMSPMCISRSSSSSSSSASSSSTTTYPYPPPFGHGNGNNDPYPPPASYAPYDHERNGHFLPHAPQNPYAQQPRPSLTPVVAMPEKPRRKRGSRNSVSPPSPSSRHRVDPDDAGYDDDADVPHTPRPSKRAGDKRCSAYYSMCKSMSGLGFSHEPNDDGGCLGGF